jgi:hypothetical protein
VAHKLIEDIKAFIFTLEFLRSPIKKSNAAYNVFYGIVAGRIPDLAILSARAVKIGWVLQVVFAPNNSSFSYLARKAPQLAFPELEIARAWLRLTYRT